MKKLVFKKWVEVVLAFICAVGIFLIGGFEHHDFSLYIYGILLFSIPIILELKYGRD